MATSMEKSALQLKCRFASNSMPPGYGSEPLTGQKGGGRNCAASAGPYYGYRPYYWRTDIGIAPITGVGGSKDRGRRLCLPALTSPRVVTEF